MDTLFNQLYKASAGAKKALLRPTKKREVERQFQAHYDNLAEQAADAADAIVEQYKRIGEKDQTVDINILIKKRVFIQNATKNQEACANEYKILFQEDIKGVSVKEMISKIFNEDGSLKIGLEVEEESK